VTKLYLIALCLLAGGLSNAQSTAHAPLRFDLSKIGMVVNGEQLCEDKGRLQDVPSKAMDQITEAGPKAVPILIGMLADSRVAKTKEPITCYWGAETIGDIAFCLLSDLFTDTNDQKTMPGAGWNDILGPSNNLPAADQLHLFIRKHGIGALQLKWRQLWNKYRDQVFWDPKERCFKLRPSK
jgi:hypothetical protein